MGFKFVGRFQHNLDDKSRLTIPSRLREGLGSPFYATVGLEKSIVLYSLQEWEKISEQLQQLPMTNRDARAFNRLFFSGAIECEPDKQGRVLLPLHLIKHAGLKKEAMIVGVLDRVEIWSLEGWEKYEEEKFGIYEDVAENISSAGN
ncbi:MAG: division/cell wall cluster transcriptional repressor MraZ [Firmicutes bacterium]|nr:division/cell wall cluster transcriptional repressor MraZ [Bacillota bacterium]